MESTCDVAPAGDTERHQAYWGSRRPGVGLLVEYAGQPRRIGSMKWRKPQTEDHCEEDHRNLLQHVRVAYGHVQAVLMKVQRQHRSTRYPRPGRAQVR